MGVEADHQKGDTVQVLIIDPETIENVCLLETLLMLSVCIRAPATAVVMEPVFPDLLLLRGHLFDIFACPH